MKKEVTTSLRSSTLLICMVEVKKGLVYRCRAMIASVGKENKEGWPRALDTQGESRARARVRKSSKASRSAGSRTGETQRKGMKG